MLIMLMLATSSINPISIMIFNLLHLSVPYAASAAPQSKVQ